MSAVLPATFGPISTVAHFFLLGGRATSSRRTIPVAVEGIHRPSRTCAPAQVVHPALASLTVQSSQTLRTHLYLVGGLRLQQTHRRDRRS